MSKNVPKLLEKTFSSRNQLNLAGLHLSKSNTDHLLFFIHGWLDNAASFIDLMNELDLESLSIDLAGHGRSQHRGKDGSYAIWEYAMDIANLVNNLPHKKITLVGHSLGTGVATLTAPLISGKLSRIVLLDGLGPSSTLDSHFTARFKNSYLALQDLEIKQTNRTYEPNFYESIEQATRVRMRSPIQNLDEKRAEILISRNLLKTESGYKMRVDPRIFLPSTLRLNEAQIVDLISYIDVPTLGIFGNDGIIHKINERGMEDIKKEDLDKRQKSFKNLKTHWVEGDHYLHMGSYSAKTASLIMDFLNE